MGALHRSDLFDFLKRNKKKPNKFLFSYYVIHSQVDTQIYNLCMFIYDVLHNITYREHPVYGRLFSNEYEHNHSLN